MTAEKGFVVRSAPFPLSASGSHRHCTPNRLNSFILTSFIQAQCFFCRLAKQTIVIVIIVKLDFGPGAGEMFRSAHLRMSRNKGDAMERRHRRLLLSC